MILWNKMLYNTSVQWSRVIRIKIHAQFYIAVGVNWMCFCFLIEGVNFNQKMLLTMLILHWHQFIVHIKYLGCCILFTSNFLKKIQFFIQCKVQYRRLEQGYCEFNSLSDLVLSLCIPLITWIEIGLEKANK